MKRNELCGLIVLLIGAAPIKAQMPPGWVEVPPVTHRDGLMCANGGTDRPVSLSPDSSGLVVGEWRGRPEPRELETVDGVLRRWNMGEFGGAVTWHPFAGAVDTIYRANPIALMAHEGGPVVVQGLAHRMFDDGSVDRLVRGDSGWRVSSIADLLGAPLQAIRQGTDTLVVVTTRSVELVDLAEDRRWAVHANADWIWLYANSVVAIEGAFFIGARQYVLEVRPDSPSNPERWWAPGDCPRLEVTDRAPLVECRCVG